MRDRITELTEICDKLAEAIGQMNENMLRLAKIQSQHGEIIEIQGQLILRMMNDGN